MYIRAPDSDKRILFMPSINTAPPSHASESLTTLIQSTGDHDLLVEVLGALSQDPPAPRILLSPNPMNTPTLLLRKIFCCAQTPTVETSAFEAQHPLLNVIRPRRELPNGPATTTLEDIGNAVCDTLHQQEAVIQHYEVAQNSELQANLPHEGETLVTELPVIQTPPPPVFPMRPADMDETRATLWATRQSQMDDLRYFSLPPKQMPGSSYECPVSLSSWPKASDDGDTVIQYPVSFLGEDAVYEFTSLVESYIRSGLHPTGREDLDMSDLQRVVGYTRSI